MDTRTAILSALRKLGWACKGGVAATRGSDALVAVSFQKSQYDSLHFVNIGIWFLALGEPGNLPKHDRCHLQFRMERLFPELSGLLEPGGNLGLLEKKVLDEGARLKRLTELAHLRELHASGALAGGLITKEARALLS